MKNFFFLLAIMLMAVTTATAGTETSIEAKLASLMGTTVYADERGNSIYADSDNKKMVLGVWYCVEK